MKIEKFFAVVGSVLLASGVFAYSIGVLVYRGLNYYSDDSILYLGTFLIFLGIVSLVYAGVKIILNNKKSLKKDDKEN